MTKEYLLKEIGLTNTEIKVYLKLLDLDSPTTGELSKETDIFSKNTYDALAKLTKKGLVTHSVKDGVKCWQCTSPERIKSMIEEKLDIANELLPQLQRKFEQKNNERRVEVYDGKGGIKALHNLILKEEKTVYNIGATNKFFEYLEFYAPQFIRIGSQRQMKAKFIYNSDVKIPKEFQKNKNFEYRYLPKNFQTATQILLFGDYSCILIWSTDPMAILIKNKEITKGFMQYFNFLWDISK